MRGIAILFLSLWAIRNLSRGRCRDGPGISPPQPRRRNWSLSRVNWLASKKLFPRFLYLSLFLVSSRARAFSLSGLNEARRVRDMHLGGRRCIKIRGGRSLSSNFWLSFFFLESGSKRFRVMCYCFGTFKVFGRILVLLIFLWIVT